MRVKRLNVRHSIPSVLPSEQTTLMFSLSSVTLHKMLGFMFTHDSPSKREQAEGKRKRIP